MARVQQIPNRAEQLEQERDIPAEHRLALAQGAAEWDAGQFFDAHETWEDVWQIEQRPIRSFYQGLILLAAGLHHWTKTHRPRGVRIKLAGGVERLAPYAPTYLGVDVIAMLTDAGALQRQAAPLDADGLAQTPLDSFPRFHWTSSAAGESAVAAGAGTLQVLRLRDGALLPQRTTALSSGLDLHAELSDLGGALELAPEPTLIPTGIAIALQPGFEAQVRPRSGLSRRGVDVAFGTIDADYRGEILVNMSLRGADARGYTVQHGDRIAQLVVAPVARPPIIEAKSLPDSDRGHAGFGSSGR